MYFFFSDFGFYIIIIFAFVSNMQPRVITKVKKKALSFTNIYIYINYLFIFNI